MTTPYITRSRLEALTERLSPRERDVLATFERVRLASGSQLERLHFSDVGSRERRRILARLENQRLLARLGRRVGGTRSGSAGFLYALDVAGQRLLGALGAAPNHPARTRRPWIPGRLFVAHTVAITELYVRLVEAARTNRGVVGSFHGEPQCWRDFLGRGGARLVLKPDAYLRLSSGQYDDHWFVEIDCGTEAPSTLERKAAVYRSYWSTGRETARIGVFPKVVFFVPDTKRLQVLVDVFSRQPADAWQLFSVALFEDAIEHFEKGAVS